VGRTATTQEFGPALKIRVDLNMAESSPKEALRLIRSIELRTC